jgi:hypothetical protein
MKTPKANYKIFDTKIGSYVKRTKGKQTWNSESWALSAGWDHADEKSAGRKHETENYCLLYLEIHTFPIESAIIETWAARVEKNRAASAIKKAADAIKAEKRKERETLERIEILKQKMMDFQEEIDLLTNC